ncbi:carbohydrate ABC transporter permease [Diplocloster hominis]|uniref:carbohydrate ABC transporter permease n=1 Tax=Diplocloster hominis TaxID=3079010 RepID=UPI0031BAE3E3
MKKKKRNLAVWLGDIFGVIFGILIFVVPFLFMIVNSLKDKKEANLLRITLPAEFHLENYLEVFKTGNYVLLRAFKNSILITVGTVLILILVCSMCGYILQRRRDKKMNVLNMIILSGLMVPPAILPTIWVLQGLHIYKTLFGLIMVETALQIPFTVILYRSYIGTIPVELEEAGYIDGCSRLQLFQKIIFPLLKPVTATVTLINAVNVFNDFTNPLYFLPGTKNSTVQLTLFNFMGQYANSYNLLFADVVIITLPMLLLFVFFNRQIVDGMVAGSVKG